MSRLRDVALVVALLAVGVAAIWGPKPGSGDSRLAPTTTPPPSTVSLPGPTATALADLELSAAEVVATATPDRSVVLSVHLTARLRSPTVVMLRADPTGPAIRFTLTPPGSVGTAATVPTSLPATIPAAITVPVDLTFDLRGLSTAPAVGQLLAAGPPPPGTWLLTVDLIDVSGARHHAETPVTIAPTV